MTSSRLFFGALIVIVISTSYLLVRSPAFGAHFAINNDSSQEVTITATWRDQQRELGTVLAESSLAFRVKDEAAMVFLVRYADGREIETKPIYFTSGTSINVIITDQGADALHDAGS